MSPEQAQAKALDRRTDLWSIAVLTFEALLGRRPFVAESLGDLVIAICTAPTPVPSRIGPVPPGFDEWFVRGTQRDPARRFQTAQEMSEELAAVIGPNPRRVTTSRNPVITPSMAEGLASFAAAAQRASTQPRASSSSVDLHLTTGQRSAVTRSASPAPAARGSNTGLFALLALGTLILIGVVMFAFGGGARALHEAELSATHAAVVPAATLDEHAGTVPATLPSAAPAPALSGASRTPASAPR